jgi:abortive infection bacteriophage resistance protein
MNYNKLPFNITEQIEKLKKRGLVFNDESRAEHYISNIGYYRLRAYTFPFQNNALTGQPFNEKITFEQIIQLYVFDRRLRLLIFDAIEKIEVALRAKIIYYFAQKHGSHWQLKPELYSDTMRFVKHLASLQKEIDRSNEAFITHYKNKYTNPTEPPCWMSLEVSSMGLLSKLFQNLKKCPEKLAILKFFKLADIKVLENWILCFSTLRNICAHHGRVWNRRLVPIKIPTQAKSPFLINKNIYVNKIYATLSCIEYSLKIISPTSTLVKPLKQLINTCSVAQMKEMGFPEDWLDEPIWQ